METIYCGIDLHQRFSTVCIMDQAGDIMEERKLMHGGGELKEYFARKEMNRTGYSGGSVF